MRRTKVSMCKMASIKTAYGTRQVAEHKSACISNIMDAARKQKPIFRVVLFGSATSEACREDSDIDIALFGSASKGAMLKSAQYKTFLRDIRHFDKAQNYDMLYFNADQYDQMQGGFKDAIENGVILYERSQ